MKHTRGKGLVAQLRIGSVSEKSGKYGAGKTVYPQLLLPARSAESWSPLQAKKASAPRGGVYCRFVWSWKGEEMRVKGNMIRIDFSTKARPATWCDPLVVGRALFSSEKNHA
jgi:hypothetical protein